MVRARGNSARRRCAWVAGSGVVALSLGAVSCGNDANGPAKAQASGASAGTGGSENANGGRGAAGASAGAAGNAAFGGAAARSGAGATTAGFGTPGGSGAGGFAAATMNGGNVAAGVSGDGSSSGGSAGAGGDPSSGGSGGRNAAGTGGSSAGSGGTSGGSTATFQNPLNDGEGSNPWLLHYEGNYYLAATTWSNVLTLRRASTLDGLKSAEAVTVWTGDQSSRCCNFWAPEFHLLDGPNGKRWYLYYTAGPAGTDTANQRMHVLESAGTDPLGPYNYKARLYDSAADSWAIDASVFSLGDRLYYLFSAWEGENQNVYIAALSNPWTISGRRSRLSSPTLAWERQLANVNEGPVALQRNGRTFVVYSASACWGPDYKLGMLSYDGTGDPLSERSWTKHPDPVFERSDPASVYGPAHNGFFRSPDGSEDWIVYHANETAAGVCDTRRTTRAQPFGWNQDGTPDFGAPLATEAKISVPSGE